MSKGFSVFIFVVCLFFLLWVKESFVHWKIPSTFHKEMEGGESVSHFGSPHYFNSALLHFDRAHAIQETSPNVDQDTSLDMMFKRIEVGHSEANGVGNRFGYTSIGLLLGPTYALGRWLPLVDLGGLIFNNGSLGGYGGFVMRYIPQSVACLPGVNVFYDVQKGHRAVYQDVGVGIELLSARWDVRANGYIRVGKKFASKKNDLGTAPGGYFAFTRSGEFDYGGADAELGCLVFEKRGFFLYTAVGPYYLHGNSRQDIWGVQGRLQPQYKDYVALRLSVSHDHHFGTIVQGEVFLTLPLYDFFSMKNRKGPGKITNRQIYQPVIRRPFVPVGGSCCFISNF